MKIPKNIFGPGRDGLLLLLLLLYMACIFSIFEIGVFQNEKVRAHKEKSNQVKSGAYAELRSEIYSVADTEKTQIKISEIIHDSEEPVREVLLQRKKILANDDASLVCVEYLVDDSAKGVGLEFAVYDHEGMRRGAKQWHRDCSDGKLKDYTNASLQYLN